MFENREFVSNVGTGADLLQKLAKAVYAKGGQDEDLVRIISDESLRAKLADLIVGEKPAGSNVYSIIVDWSRTLAEMIDAGHYDWVNKNINEENFPLVQPPVQPVGPDLGPYRTSGKNGQREINPELIHYGKWMTTKVIEADLDRRGLRPATLAELLAFAEKYPDLQRKFPIVARGSAWVDPRGSRDVPYLCGDSCRRGLYLSWDGPGCGWPDNCRFLAVRK